MTSEQIKQLRQILIRFENMKPFVENIRSIKDRYSLNCDSMFELLVSCVEDNENLGLIFDKKA
jgi:hypothetical protein